jgi:hypothetical protein
MPKTFYRGGSAFYAAPRAAAANSPRKAVFSAMGGTLPPEAFWSDGLAKFGRAPRGVPKTHQNDAICVGLAAREIIGRETIKTLAIESKGLGACSVIGSNKINCLILLL